MATRREWLARIARGDSNRQVADRAGISDALLGHLPEEPELWQLQMIGAACLGRREWVCAWWSVANAT